MDDKASRPPSSEYLFFTLMADARTAADVGRFTRRFRRDNRIGDKPIAAERLHLSLNCVRADKHVKTKFLWAARQAGSAVSMKPFEVTFRGITSFPKPPSRDGKPRKHALVLLAESHELLDLYKHLGLALETFGFRTADHFNPHMTLLYSKQIITLRPIAPLRMVATGFKLVRSLRGLSRYDILEDWPAR